MKMTVKQLIEKLQQFPLDMIVKTQRWENRYSGSMEDTDMSDYVDTDITCVRIKKIYIPFDKNDPHYKDKRRTRFCNEEEIVFIEG